MAKTFDVAVIGAGPGGYVAAIRCGQLGLNTVCVDEWKNDKGKPSLGGTCLNVGCIPSKALLESSENYQRVKHKFAEHGIQAQNVSLDVAAMLARKNKIVENFTGGIALLFKKNKVAAMHGKGRLVSAGAIYRIEIADNGKTETIEAKHVIIATGSVPRPLPGAEVDNNLIVDNAGALAFNEAPKRLGLVGAGVIGLEMGSVWRRLGSEVTILEALPGFLPAADEQVAKEAQKIFTREQGLDIRTGVKITSVKTGKKQVTVEYRDAQGASQTLECDKLIVAIGRMPNTSGLGAEKVGLKLDGGGFIEVDAHCRTNLPNLFAIGDVVRGPMLAHKASEEGVMVAETIAGQAGHINPDTIPWVIYTSPEIAWVGKTEQELKKAGAQYRTGQFPFMANGRARSLGETAGFVKILADARTDRILGVHIIGPYASEMIAEAVVAMEFAASAEDIARIVHAHPSLSEAFHEAALGVDKRTLHI
ncbi:MAG TPA: dihydrolipoyl dehydrogenase [Burkholderiales bacterium]|nr:dihydrolipoyl dehydrogenase [Burkholderiales bacterium]